MGVSQFLFMGWPDEEEMIFFGKEILPAIREREDKIGKYAELEAGRRNGGNLRCR
jgi:hypothetical protein